MMHYRSRRVALGVFSLAMVFAAGCARVDPDAELAAGTAAFRAGNYNEAAIRLNNVVQVEPDNAEARRLRGEIALWFGNYADAVAELDRARALGTPMTAIAVSLADALALQGQAERAVEILGSAQDSLSNSAHYWTVRAEALLAAGRLGEAERALDDADRLGGGPRAQMARARIAYARNDVVTAEQLLDGALRVAPDEPGILVARAELFARTDRLAEAAADFQRAADLYRAESLMPREVLALLALAQVHLASNNLDAAEATAMRLAERAPEAALTAYMQGLIEYRRGRFDAAAALVQPLVSAAPETVQFRALLGAIHLARGNFGQAEQQLQMVLASAPRDPAAIKLLAETHLRQQRPEAALATLRPVADTATEDPQVGLLSGLASLLAGNTEQGLLYLEQAASLDPGNELLKLQLARAYLATGKDTEASALLEDALGGGPASLDAGLLRLFAAIRQGASADGTAATELLEQFPRDPRALTAVAIYYQLRGDSGRARQLFEQAAGLETDTATARLIVAAALVQEGRSQEAEQLLSRVVAEQPDNTQAATALAEILTARGAYDDAAELLTRAADQSDSVAPRVALAHLNIRRGDLMAAKRELDVASAAAPANAEVAFAFGVLALAERRFDDAVAVLRRAESDLPGRMGVSVALARAELGRERPEEARAVLHRVLEAAPRSLPLRFLLGQAELMLGNATAALTIASELKAEYPTQSGGYLLEADVNVAARRYAAAADGFAEAFEREGTWPVMTRWLGALQLAGRSADALRENERWVAAHPEHAAGALTLAGLLQTAARNEEALGVYEKVLGSDADNLIALNNAAWLAHELARPAALAYAERAYVLDSSNPAVLDTFGWILLSQNREAEAIEHLSRAAELAPQVPEIRYHLARALATGGRSTEARAALVPLLEPGVRFDQKEEAQRLLESL